MITALTRRQTLIGAAATVAAILDPVRSMFGGCGSAVVETYVAQEHPPAWELVASENLADGTDITQD